MGAGLGENATEMAEYSKENLDLYSFELSAAEMTYALLLRTAHCYCALLLRTAHFTMRRSIYRESATKSMRCVLRLTDCCVALRCVALRSHIRTLDGTGKEIGSCAQGY